MKISCVGAAQLATARKPMRPSTQRSEDEIDAGSSLYVSLSEVLVNDLVLDVILPPCFWIVQLVAVLGPSQFKAKD